MSLEDGTLGWLDVLPALSNGLASRTHVRKDADRIARCRIRLPGHRAERDAKSFLRDAHFFVLYDAKKAERGSGLIAADFGWKGLPFGIPQHQRAAMEFVGPFDQPPKHQMRGKSNLCAADIEVGEKCAWQDLCVWQFHASDNVTERLDIIGVCFIGEGVKIIRGDLGPDHIRPLLKPFSRRRSVPQCMSNRDRSFLVLMDACDPAVFARFNDGAPLAFRSGHVVGEVANGNLRLLDLSMRLFGHESPTW